MDEFKTIEKLSADDESIKLSKVEYLNAEDIVTADTLSMEKMETTLKESLSVIKDVREELSDAYKTAKTQKEQIEKLNSEFASLTNIHSDTLKTVESLSKELADYKAREEEVEKLAYNKRLEKLSLDFKSLGQEKTVEQLSKLPKEVISEFETITSMALGKEKLEKLSKSMTVPTQSMPDKKKESLSTEPKQKPVESLSNNDFFKNLADQLNTRQYNTNPTRV